MHYKTGKNIILEKFIQTILFYYRIPEDDEEDVDADGRDVCSPTSSAALMRDGVDKIDHGHGEM